MNLFFKNYIIFLLVFICFFSFEARSAELKFITLEVAPWAYRDEKSDGFIGIFPELIHGIEAITGHEIKITLTPYIRINRELEAARQDCTMLIRDKEREENSIKGELIFNHPMGVVARKSLILEQYEDLYEIKISLLRGSAISERFDSDDNLKKDFDTDYEISLQKINHGRLDAIAGAIPTIQYLAKKNGFSNLLGEPLKLNSEPIYLQCSKKSKKLQYIDSINRAIRDIKKDGVLDAIIDKYS